MAGFGTLRSLLALRGHITGSYYEENHQKTFDNTAFKRRRQI